MAAFEKTVDYARRKEAGRKTGSKEEALATDEMDSESAQLISPDTGWHGLVDLLMTRYSMTLEEVEGRYEVRCSSLSGACTMCLGPRSFQCPAGRLSVRGLDAVNGRMLSSMAMDAALAEKLARMYSESGKLPWGGTKSIGAGSGLAVENDGFVDVYAKFPDDRPSALSEDQIQARVKTWHAVARMRGAKGQRSQAARSGEWGQERVEAARGKRGKIARRCAADDLSWALYKEMPNGDADYFRRRLTAILLQGMILTAKDETKKLLLMERLERL